MGDAEIAAVTEVIRSGWLSRGPATEAFEAELGAYLHPQCPLHVAALSSCTAALHLSLVALGIGPGDRVLTSPLTFPATVNAILYVGAKPVFGDVDPEGNLNLASVPLSESRLAAVIPVDLHGAPCCATWELPQELPIIRDAAHSLGADMSGVAKPARGMKQLYSHHDRVACYSFYPTKNVGGAEGGAVATRDPALAERIRCLAQHGMDRAALVSSPTRRSLPVGPGGARV